MIVAETPVPFRTSGNHAKRCRLLSCHPASYWRRDHRSDRAILDRAPLDSARNRGRALRDSCRPKVDTAVDGYLLQNALELSRHRSASGFLTQGLHFLELLRDISQDRRYSENATVLVSKR
jgi:hypothetical protein